MSKTGWTKAKVLLWITLGMFTQTTTLSEIAHQTQPPEERIHQFSTQEVILKDFEASGPILDLGGGGEGVIGRLKGEQVVAIDISGKELEEAPDGPLKIVMDAADLQFLDSSFDIATSFFTLMYIPGTLHQKVFTEVHRVLRQKGRFLVWDVILPPRKDPKKDIAVFPMLIKFPAGDVVETGYGVKWPSDGRDAEHFRGLARETGFEVVKFTDDGQWFFLQLQKK
jgi:ubiquinone/menaquinone biosynthesis C-methylase UbiE